MITNVIKICLVVQWANSQSSRHDFPATYLLYTLHDKQKLNAQNVDMQFLQILELLATNMEFDIICIGIKFFLLVARKLHFLFHLHTLFYSFHF